MKNQSHILLAILLFFGGSMTSVVAAQNQKVVHQNSVAGYARFLNNSKWFVVRSTWEGYQTSYIYYHGDTLVNGTIYQKLMIRYLKLPNHWAYPYAPYEGEYLYNLIREDTETKKIYILSISNKESVLYDFSLNIGDKLPTNTAFVLSNIDSIDTRSGKHKCFTFSSSDDKLVYWYEGIGNPAHPFDSSSTLSSSSSYVQLFCMYQNDSTVYENCRLTDVDCADYVRLQTALPSVKGASEMVYPNPTTGKVQIVAGSKPVYSVEVSDALGRVVMVVKGSCTAPITEFDLSDYCGGIYFCTLHTASGSSVFKVLKKE